MRFFRNFTVRGKGAVMPQDAFHIRRLTQELNEVLRGGKINRISQVSKDELTFIVYTGKTTLKLIISSNATGARVCISDSEKEPLAVAPNFCMLLRKHLQGAEILSIAQRETERIVEITLHCTGDFSQCDRVLVCELMGKYSNVVLTEKGVVLGALKTTALMDDNHRVLLAGAKYEYPKPQDKLSPINAQAIDARFAEFSALYSSPVTGEDRASFLFENVAGFALSTAREIVKRQEQSDVSLGAFVCSFFQNEPCNPCLTATDFFAFLTEGGLPMPTLYVAQDKYFTSREKKKGFEDKKRRLESGVRAFKKKAQKRLQDVTQRLLDAEKAEENRIKGELLTANLYRVEKGEKSVELENWYDEKGGTIKIALDATLSPSKNAQKYFKIYNKQKRAKEILTPMQTAEEKEIDYADSVFSAIALAESDDDLKEIETELISEGLIRAPQKKIPSKKKETEIPFRVFDCDGFKIYVGRNNIQNDRLVRLAAPDDIWLHTQKYHSSHVIIAVEGRQVRDEIILRAAEICAWYSDGRDSDKIPVDYCKRKFVKKPSKSKAGFVVYTDYKTVLVKPKKCQEI